FMAATSQRGLAPLPAHNSPPGPLYFAATFRPFNALTPRRPISTYMLDHQSLADKWVESSSNLLCCLAKVQQRNGLWEIVCYSPFCGHRSPVFPRYDRRYTDTCRVPHLLALVCMLRSLEVDV